MYSRVLPPLTELTLDSGTTDPSPKVESTARRIKARRGSRIKEPTPISICDATIRLGDTSAGDIFCNLVKQFLYLRALLPAQFDSIGTTILNPQKETKCYHEDADNTERPVKRRKQTPRRNHGAHNRLTKLIHGIQRILDTVVSLETPPDQPITFLLILGPKLACPKAALELCLHSLSESSPGFMLSQDSATSRNKSLQRLLRQVIPEVGSLPNVDVHAVMKMFVCVKLHSSHSAVLGDGWSERDGMTCSLKKCSALSVRVMDSEERKHAPTSDLEQWRAADVPNHVPDEPPIEDNRSWYVFEESVKGLKYYDVG